MKRILPTLLIALLAGPAALAQGAADPPPPDQPLGQRDRPPQRERGDDPRGERGDGERGDRPERGPRGEGERGPRGERPQGESDDHDWQLTAEQLDDAIGLIERMSPRLAGSLRETQQESPQRAIERIRTEAPRTYELLRMRAQEPERYALHIRSMQIMRDTRPLIHQLRTAQREEDQPKIDALTAQVREAVEAFYEVRMALRELDIQKLRDELELLEADHEQDRDRREELINSRVEEITDGRRGRRQGERGEPSPRGDAPDAQRPREGRGPRD